MGVTVIAMFGIPPSLVRDEGGGDGGSVGLTSEKGRDLRFGLGTGIPAFA